MKNRIVHLIAMLVLCLPVLLKAQDKSRLKANFSTLAIFREPEQQFKGYLVELQEAEMVFSASRKLPAGYGPEDVQRVAIANIDMLKFRKRSSPAIGAAIGFAVGTAAGLLIGLNHEVEPRDDAAEVLLAPIEEVGRFLGTVFLSSMVGAGTGTLIASKRKSYPLNGSQELYDQWRGQFEKYTMKK